MSPSVQMSRLGTFEDRLSSTPISKGLRHIIIDKVFKIDRVETQHYNNENLDCYFNDWYEDQCEAAARQVSIKTHGEILYIIALLQDCGSSKEGILEKIRLTDTESPEEYINASIELAARLWLTISIGSLRQTLTPGNTVIWQEGQLCRIVDRVICPTTIADDHVRLPKVFNAANIESIAGIQVLWTSDLADHLCLTDDDTKLKLYHQVSFLELHKRR